MELSDLKPNPKNPRKITDKKLKALKKSMNEFGDLGGVIFNKRSGQLIGGHQRISLLKDGEISLGESGEFGFIIKDGQSFALRVVDWDESRENAANLAANKGAGEWDWDGLKDMMKDLDEANFDLELTMFDEDEIKDLLKEPEVYPEGFTDPDEIPENVETRCKLGDLWLLGNHRLLCGDSTDVLQVERLMGGEKADMVFTSPPYNANTKTGDGDIFNKKKTKKLYADGYSDNLDSEQYIDFSKSVLEVCFMVTEGFIFWNVSYNSKSKFEYIAQIIDRLPFLVDQICWKKSSTIPFKGSLMRDWEPIYVFSTRKKSLGLKKVTSNHWEVNNTNSQQENHKACFPVELPERGIHIVESNTGIVFEPFCGSGSTLIACEKTKRECYGMELDPKYCDVIISRWEKYTGQQAVLAGN